MKGLTIIAIIFGATVATATLMIESLSSSQLVFILIPGLIASMAVSGNVHAFPLWIAALVNFGFYFLICLGLGKIVKSIRKRSKAQSHYSGS
jgi:hypothetical protein